MHRDLKPENVLLDATGRIKLADFGTCKCMYSGDVEHNAFVGTAEYVSPEVLRDEVRACGARRARRRGRDARSLRPLRRQEAGFASDLWALGCLVFQLLVGRPPFRADSEFLMFQTILEHPGNGALSFPDTVPSVARVRRLVSLCRVRADPCAPRRGLQDLVNSLLVQAPEERLGGGPSPHDVDHAALKAHPFFEGIDWDALLERRPPVQPPREQLPPCTTDGANPDWLLEDAATELDEAQFHTCAPALCPEAQGTALVCDSVFTVWPAKHRSSTEVQRVLAKGSAQPRPELARETELWCVAPRGRAGSDPLSACVARVAGRRFCARGRLCRCAAPSPSARACSPRPGGCARLSGRTHSALVTDARARSCC